MQDLKLDYLFVIFPGNLKFPMQAKIMAYGLDLIEQLDKVVDAVQ